MANDHPFRAKCVNPGSTDGNSKSLSVVRWMREIPYVLYRTGILCIFGKARLRETANLGGFDEDSKESQHHH